MAVGFPNPEVMPSTSEIEAHYPLETLQSGAYPGEEVEGRLHPEMRTPALGRRWRTRDGARALEGLPPTSGVEAPALRERARVRAYALSRMSS